MSLILYLPRKEKAEERLLWCIRKEVPDQDIEIHSSIGELLKRLQQPLPDVHVAVLYAANCDELMELIYLGDVLGELRVVLVLPDNHPELLEKAFVLRPRFIAAAESDFNHLGGILKRMIERYDKKY